MVVTPIMELVLTRSHSPCSKYRQGVQQAAPDFIPLLVLLKLMFGTSMKFSICINNPPVLTSCWATRTEAQTALSCHRKDGIHPFLWSTLQKDNYLSSWFTYLSFMHSWKPQCFLLPHLWGFRLSWPTRTEAPASLWISFLLVHLEQAINNWKHRF